MKNLSLKRSKKGFTLIELSVVLVIVGIMVYGATSMFAMTAAKARIDATNNTLDAIERALRLHYQTAGRLPCVAVGNLPLGNASFGVENCTGTAGVVPTRTLNLPDSYMFDGWGNRISYVVDTDCDTAWVSETCAANITIQDNSGADNRTTTAAYALISYGKNGLGAFNRNGGSNGAATVAAELENTDADTTFRDDFIRDWDGVGATYFDDMVRWKIPAQISYED